MDIPKIIQEEIPVEIWYYIFDLLSENELIKTSWICKQFRVICLDKTIWKKRAYFLEEEPIVLQYVKWRKQVKYENKADYNCGIENLSITGERIIRTPSKNYLFDKLTMNTLIPGILVTSNTNKEIMNLSKKKYRHFHRINIFRLDKYSLTTEVKYLKHDMRRFYIIEIPSNYDKYKSIRLIKKYMDVQNDYDWVNIFAIVCSKNLVKKNELVIYDSKVRIFEEENYVKVFEWIIKMIWIDNFKDSTTYCPKKIPTRKELFELTTDLSIKTNRDNTCCCQ